MKKFRYIILLLIIVVLLSVVFVFKCKKIEAQTKKDISPTLNKSAIFFGDSITYGEDGYSWANYLNDHYDFKECINVGHKGWLLSYHINKKNLVLSMFEYKDKKYDYVILHGGTNDIGRNAPLGDYDKNDFSGKYDTDTFIGGLERYIYVAKKYWPNAKIGYIINYKTPNSNKNRAHLSVVYYSKMKEVLKKWNIPYINLYNGKTKDDVYFSDLLEVDSNKYIKDGVHLNMDGYNLISPYIYDWVKNL